MTGSVIPPTPEAQDRVVSELHALYRETAQTEPSAMLDRNILEAARTELKSDHAMKSRRPKLWWRRWLPATSAIAVALVGLSVTWRVVDEQERDLRREMKAVQGVREGSVETAGSAAPAQGAADAPPLPSAPAPAAQKSRRAESAVAKDASPVAGEPSAFPAPVVPAATAPAPAEQVVKKIPRLQKDEVRERRDADAAADYSPAPARQVGKLEARSPGAGSDSEAKSDALGRPAANLSAKSVAASLAQPVTDAATPEAWLKQIRELRAAGRSAEAVQSLARFRARYPDFALPDDLVDLK